MPVTERSKNIVQKQSRVPVKKKVVEPNYIPGVYKQHHPSQCDHMLASRPIHLTLEKSTEGKQMRQIIERDNIRDLLIPANDINVHPAIWEESELKRLKNGAKVITMEDRIAEIERREAEKQRLSKECEKRKLFLKEIDRARYKKTVIKKDNNDDEDVKVMDKLAIAKHEEEEEIRKANRIILTTKCQIIRDAQIAEKNEIEKELREENLRLEKIINENVNKGLKQEEVEREHKKKLNEKHAQELKNQLKAREVKKFLEAERIEEEAKSMAKAQVAITLDMLEKDKQRKEKIKKVKTDLQRANELSEFFKRLEFEEQRIADLKVQEYMREKNEREKRLAVKKRIERVQQERERERLLELQTRLLETKSAQSDMGMRREQEEKEREFRKREKEAALKKQEILREMEKSRAAQLEELKRAKAYELAKEEKEHIKLVEKLKKDLEIEKEAERMRHINNKKYRDAIISQINEKEINRKEQLRRAKTEYESKLEEEDNRKKTVKTVILTKIKDMTDNKVPDKFIKDVERQLHKYLTT